LDLDFKFLKPFGLSLDLNWVLKIQDWIWIAKYDSPFISDPQQALIREEVQPQKNFGLSVRPQFFFSPKPQPVTVT